MNLSVLAKDRKLSQYQFYISAIKLRKSLVELLLRDFGVKHKARELGVRVRKMDEETHKRFVNLATKYGMPTELAAYPAWMASAAKDTIENSLEVWTADMTDEERDEFLDIALSYSMTCITTEYPGWLVQKLRDSVWDISRDLLLSITRAYTIWATNRREAEERRVYQDRAIADCESLLKEMELAIDVLPVKADKYMTITKRIGKEIALLKGWRKADNKRNKERFGS